MRSKRFSVSAAAILFLSSVSFAEGLESEFERGFGTAQGITDSDKSGSEKDRLLIGGSLWSEFFYSKTGDPSPGHTFSNPNSLWLYLDSKLREDVRAFVKFRYTVDSTSSVTPSGISAAALDETKLMFNIRKSVFFTVGKQKIKWGSARFWNPTDFANTLKRDILYTDDRRAGVTLLKTHVPVGNSNVYLVNSLDDSGSQLDRLGHFLRLEMPASSAEFALSAGARKGQKPVFGADFSTALMDFDVYSELGVSQGKAAYNWVSGVSYDYQYNANDTATFVLEYFNNGNSQSSTAEYAGVIQSAAYRPFYLARHYAMFMVLLPNPGRLENVTFSIFNLGNLSDRSALTKLSTTLTSFQDLRTELGLSLHYGASDGEMKLGGARWDTGLRLMVDF